MLRIKVSKNRIKISKIVNISGQFWHYDFVLLLLLIH